MKYLAWMCSTLLAGGIAMAQSSDTNTVGRAGACLSQQASYHQSGSSYNPGNGQYRQQSNNTRESNSFTQQSSTAQGSSYNQQSSNSSRQNTDAGQQSNASDHQNHKIQASRLAVRVLADTNQARDAISQRNQSTASNCINDALSALSRMKSTASTAQNGHASNLVPIYTEVGQVTVLGPIYNEQQHRSGTHASNQNSRNSQQGAATATRGEASREETVQDVTQGFTSVTLDTATAQNHLQAARTALQSGNFDAADAALKAVQDAVTMVSVAADRPLVRARENLMLARDLAQQGKYRDMNASLTAAADALQSYQSANTTHSSEARNLSEQIRSYANNIGASNSGTSNNSTSNYSASNNGNSAAQKIDTWWNKLDNWSSSRQ
jgi:hypothetical protein